ncbi:MAG: hypothetical protein ABJI96_00880 [Paracoccaceae bacterium]
MHRLFIAGIISVSIAITALSAKSVAASDRQTTNILAGFAGLAILGAIIHDSGKKNKDTNYTSRNVDIPQSYSNHDHIRPAPVHRHKYHADPHHNKNVHNKHNHKAKPLPKRLSRKLLPGQCLRRLETRRGYKRLFSDRCLNNNFRHVNRLPEACYTEFRSDGRKHRGYGARCLRKNGYSIARN